MTRWFSLNHSSETYSRYASTRSWSADLISSTSSDDYVPYQGEKKGKNEDMEMMDVDKGALMR